MGSFLLNTQVLPTFSRLFVLLKSKSPLTTFCVLKLRTRKIDVLKIGEIKPSIVGHIVHAEVFKFATIRSLL